MKQLYTFAPRKEDIEIIQKETSADTICLHRVYGEKFSARRKAGAFAMSVLAAMVGVITYGGPHDMVHDMVESYFVFIDAKTGAVLWQYGLYTTGDPLEPGQEYIAGVLKFFPTKNECFDEETCTNGKDGFFYCK